MQPEAILRPYLDTILGQLKVADGSSVNASFTAFYVRSAGELDEPLVAQLRSRNIIVCPTLPSRAAVNGDAAAVNAERVFWEAVKLAPATEGLDSFWPPLEDNTGDDDFM